MNINKMPIIAMKAPTNSAIAAFDNDEGAPKEVCRELPAENATKLP
jgi:hypothetical protein